MNEDTSRGRVSLRSPLLAPGVLHLKRQGMVGSISPRAPRQVGETQPLPRTGLSGRRGPPAPKLRSRRGQVAGPSAAGGPPAEGGAGPGRWVGREQAPFLPGRAPARVGCEPRGGPARGCQAGGAGPSPRLSRRRPQRAGGAAARRRLQVRSRSSSSSLKSSSRSAPSRSARPGVPAGGGAGWAGAPHAPRPCACPPSRAPGPLPLPFALHVVPKFRAGPSGVFLVIKTPAQPSFYSTPQIGGCRPGRSQHRAERSPLRKRPGG